MRSTLAVVLLEKRIVSPSAGRTIPYAGEGAVLPGELVPDLCIIYSVALFPEKRRLSIAAFTERSAAERRLL